MTNDNSSVEAVRSHLEAVRLQLELLTDPNLDSWHQAGAQRERASAAIEFSWLGSHPDEVSELAALLYEAAPKLGLSGAFQTAAAKTVPRRPSYEVSQSLKDRVKNAVPTSILPGVLDWSRLDACISSEMIKLEDSPMHSLLAPLLSTRASAAGSDMLEINSGGRVMFCLFSPPPATPPCSRASSPIKPPPTSARTQLDQAPGVAATEHALHDSCSAAAPPPAQTQAAPRRELCVVVKFLPSRLLAQSEQFANELTRHVGICAPESRILRQTGGTEEEWQLAVRAAAGIREQCPDLQEEMARSSCMLVMEFIPGKQLFKAREAWVPANLSQTMEDVGRLVMLDMLLGNSDRLPCEDLGWRGNLENVMYASTGPWADRMVAIDAVVQRRPPGGLLCAEDAACEKLAELALNDLATAGSVLREVVCCSRVAVAAADREDVVKAFQRGLKAALDASMTIKGLLEMMFEVVSEWIDGFLGDIEMCHNLTPRPNSSSRRSSASSGALSGDPTTTFKIRMISHEAQRNQTVSEKVAHWKTVFREKGEELRRAVEEWQLKRATVGPRLTTGFLDGTHPVVDMYELKVRLEHMLQRLRVLQDAASTARPTRLLPRLYLSGAVEANSHHLLHHLGITHVLNATEVRARDKGGGGGGGEADPTRLALPCWERAPPCAGLLGQAGGVAHPLLRHHRMDHMVGEGEAQRLNPCPAWARRIPYPCTPGRGRVCRESATPPRSQQAAPVLSLPLKPPPPAGAAGPADAPRLTRVHHAALPAARCGGGGHLRPLPRRDRLHQPGAGHPHRRRAGALPRRSQPQRVAGAGLADGEPQVDAAPRTGVDPEASAPGRAQRRLHGGAAPGGGGAVWAADGQGAAHQAGAQGVPAVRGEGGAIGGVGQDPHPAQAPRRLRAQPGQHPRGGAQPCGRGQPPVQQPHRGVSLPQGRVLHPGVPHPPQVIGRLWGPRLRTPPPLRDDR